MEQIGLPNSCATGTLSNHPVPKTFSREDIYHSTAAILDHPGHYCAPVPTGYEPPLDLDLHRSHNTPRK
ncbi:uncharacterized protein DFL_003726 [Arthrobotrys flagrans]|uniref:Uncharacterized protein n=1 Tax=Arthrobotrys flagrans TaxID=97331 RepID=A0A437A2P1_ARTFL|nr:hypothetical protein DFL_003726 [Arthrobotrys flagrans]